MTEELTEAQVALALNSDILTIEQVCIVLKCSRSTFDRKVRDHLPPINIDSNGRYWKKDVLSYAESRTGSMMP